MVRSIDQDDTTPSQQVKALETAAVKLAEGDKLIEALELFDQLITSHPNYPSAYNNRAQVTIIKRHKNTLSLSLFSQVYRLLNRVDDALSDLNTAIQLSAGVGRAAEQAYTQRGLIHILQGNEEDALQDFKVNQILNINIISSHNREVPLLVANSLRVK